MRCTIQIYVLPTYFTYLLTIVAENGDYSHPKRRLQGDCSRRKRRVWMRLYRKHIMADSIQDSIRIRIVTPDSIRYSIRTQTANSQVPRK